MWFTRILFLSNVVLSTTNAQSITDSYVLHERRSDDDARGWLEKGHVPGHALLRKSSPKNTPVGPMPALNYTMAELRPALSAVRIGLQQNQNALAKAHEWLMEVSHPSSNKYGQHWTPNEVIDAFKPTHNTLKAVKQWLMTEIGEDRITHTDNKAWFAFDALAEEMERLLRTEFYGYQHEANGESMIVCGEYYIPGHLREHIDCRSRVGHPSSI